MFDFGNVYLNMYYLLITTLQFLFKFSPPCDEMYNWSYLDKKAAINQFLKPKFEEGDAWEYDFRIKILFPQIFPHMTI